jgi:hypothetical protein
MVAASFARLASHASYSRVPGARGGIPSYPVRDMVDHRAGIRKSHDDVPPEPAVHLYTRLHRRPPAETDMQEYFRVSPPWFISWCQRWNKPASSEASQERPAHRTGLASRLMGRADKTAEVKNGMFEQPFWREVRACIKFNP